MIQIVWGSGMLPRVTSASEWERHAYYSMAFFASTKRSMLNDGSWWWAVATTRALSSFPGMPKGESVHFNLRTQPTASVGHHRYAMFLPKYLTSSRLWRWSKSPLDSLKITASLEGCSLECQQLFLPPGEKSPRTTRPFAINSFRPHLDIFKHSFLV